MTIIKRDGKIVEFSSEKIKNAITKAAAKPNEMTEADIDRITEIVVRKCERFGSEQLSVEQIQDLVEDTLL